MPILFLALAAILAAFWSLRTRRAAEALPPGQPDPEPAGGLLRRLEEEPALTGPLAEVIGLLAQVMAHSSLGGPGFLTVRLPEATGDTVLVTAQFPNIDEGLYSRVLCGELAPEALAAAGVPEALFAYAPVFSTEGGGVVVITASVSGLDETLTAGLVVRRDRPVLLAALAANLGPQCPGLSVRVLGQELLVERAFVHRDV